MPWPQFVVFRDSCFAHFVFGFYAKFRLDFVSFGLLILLSFCNSSMMEMPDLSFFISSSVLSLYVCLGPRAFRLSVYHVSDGHAVAYRTLLISVILK